MKAISALVLIMMLSVTLIACRQPEPNVVPRLPPQDDRIYVVDDNGQDGVRPVIDERSAEEIELETLMSQEPPRLFMITYRNYVKNSEGERTVLTTTYFDDENMRSEMTQKITGDGGVQEIGLRQYFVNGVYYECVDDGAWQCMRFPSPEEMPVPEDMPGSDVLHDVDTEAPDVILTKLPDRTFSGVPSTCFEFSVSSEEITETLCLAADGMMLYNRVDGPEGIMESKAITYRKNIPDNTFELPAEAQAFDPSLLQQ